MRQEQQAKKQLSEVEVLHRMAAHCSKSEHCISDIQKKISAGGLPDEANKRIIDYLLKEKFIDETRFCKSFIHDKFHFNKWGRIKIDYELKKRNISFSIYADLFDSIDENEYQNTLFSLLKQKKKTTKAKDNQDLFNKLLRFAAGRGFESKEAVSCIRKLVGTHTNHDEYLD